jgi:hypothetical protein
MIKIRWAMLIWLICIAVGGVCHPTTAHATTEILGTTSNGDSGTSTLVRIHPDNWTQLDELGSVGYLVNGMAWDNDSDTLYASTSANDSAFTGLITIDTDTGAGTPIGTDDWGQAAGYSVSNITIDSDGTMWGWADNSNQPVVIDKGTGTIMQTISATVSATNPGLSFDRIGLLFLIDGTGNLYVLDDNDTFQGPGGDNTTMARQGDFHPSTNVYYGITDTGTDTREIVLIDVYPNSGNTLRQYTTIDQLHTLAFTTTSSGSSSDSSSDSGTCFIRSLYNLDAKPSTPR